MLLFASIGLLVLVAKDLFCSEWWEGQGFVCSLCCIGCGGEDRSSGGVVVVSRLKESVDRHFLQLLADLHKDGRMAGIFSLEWKSATFSRLPPLFLNI
jgi:hypothetical protein